MKAAAGYYTYRLLSGLFGLLPEPVMRRLGYGLGWAASFVARGRFAMAVRHQARISGDGGRARRAARRVFALYGRYWAEVFWLHPRRRAKILAQSTIEGVEHLHAGARSGEGMILALPHMGNWESAGLRAAAEGARVLAVAEALPNERIVDWFTRMRFMMDIDIVIARKGARVTRDLIARLQDGGTVALLCDRDLKGNGVGVTLFGEETTMPAGPAALAERTGAHLVPVGCYFEPGAGNRFIVHPRIPVPDLPTKEERVEALTATLAGVIEGIVRRAPEQWHLIVPNWPSDREEAGA
ncbi:MAG: phosphatidylinositol mannoside acyltransferase [Actinobacteria bacterium]|nr:phosphatidylinositol mannoside acyltransferase [Actinomycetota bacterium]